MLVEQRQGEGRGQEYERGDAPAELPVRFGRPCGDLGLVAPGLSDLGFGRWPPGVATAGASAAFCGWCQASPTWPWVGGRRASCLPVGSSLD